MIQNANHKQNPKTNFIAYFCLFIFCISFFTPKVYVLKEPIEWYYPVVSGILFIMFLLAPDKILKIVSNFLTKKSNQL
jgi:hypothetical protein